MSEGQAGCEHSLRSQEDWHLAAISSTMLFYNSVAIQTAAAELSRMMTQGFCSGSIDWGRV